MPSAETPAGRAAAQSRWNRLAAGCKGSAASARREYTRLLLRIRRPALQLDAGVIGPGEASTSQAAGRHIEVTAVLLHHHVGRHFGGAKKRMLALVDREVL